MKPKTAKAELKAHKNMSTKHTRSSTIKTATANLNPELRDAIRSLWLSCGLMDLNYGNASNYVTVIQQRLDDLVLREKCLLEKIQKARAALNR